MKLSETTVLLETIKRYTWYDFIKAMLSGEEAERKEKSLEDTAEAALHVIEKNGMRHSSRRGGLRKRRHTAMDLQ